MANHTVNLGGDRLGSGQKMNVELRAYERTTFDVGYLWRSTMSAGTLVPFMTEIATPGTTYDIELNCDVKTHPTVGPLFGSYKVQLDIFSAPFRLYNGALHNNKLKIGMNMSAIKLPLIELNATVMLGDIPDITDLDNASINPSCILSYLGIRGVGINVPEFADDPRQFNALPLLIYWDIYKNYYANKQEEIGAVIHTPRSALGNTPDAIEVQTRDIATPIEIEEQGTPGPTVLITQTGSFIIYYTTLPPILSQIMVNTADGRRFSIEDLRLGTVDGTVAGQLRVYYNFDQYGFMYITSWQMIQPTEMAMVTPVVHTFPLENLDNMREAILVDTNNAAPFIVNDVGASGLEPYSLVLGATAGFNNMLNTQEGLALKTYQSDLLNNWLATEWIDGLTGITAITAISTVSGSFTIDQLNLSKKVYDLLNRVMVSGGSYDDWLDAVWTHERFRRAETPMYEGGLIKELVFQEVVSNAQSTEGTNNQPLGTLAGKGIMANKHKGGTVVVKVDEPSYLMGIVSLTPRIDYSQGNKWDVHLKTMDDLHKPALDGIGFQDLITEQMAWWATAREIGGDGTFIQTSAGKQPAWINYMTNINQTRGNFAIDGNEMFMTLNRRYEHGDLAEITDLTTYIDPAKFNNIFAQTSLDAQNFWVQISVDAKARRKMSGKQIPNL